MINNIPSNFANAIAPYAPIARGAVSQESTDLKSTIFKPAEQLADSGRGENRRLPEDRPNEEVEQDRLARASTARRSQEELEAEREQVQELSARDREVRAHEQAHAAVAGQYAGSPTYSFVRGPDGVSYAVSGEVSVDTSPIPGDPEATLRKAQQLRRAANAPAEPSAQDARVAAQAASMEIEARAEIRAQEVAEAEEQERLRNEEGRGSDEVDGGVTDAEEARRQREEERLAREEERLQQEQEQFEADQRQLDQRQARADLFNENTRRNIDINRRLLDIGVFADNNSIGNLLNKTV